MHGVIVVKFAQDNRFFKESMQAFVGDKRDYGKQRAHDYHRSNKPHQKSAKAVDFSKKSYPLSKRGKRLS